MREHPLSTGEALTPSEAAANAALVVFAGQPTTAYLLGSAVLASMRWPGADPRRLVEETLRLDSPIQGTTRRVLHTVTIGGHVLCSGDGVELWLGAANRDPARYEQPAKMQIGRRSGHLAFGAGPHACPGAALAHLTTAVGLDALARQGRLLPNGAPMWYPNASVRGLTRLPVRWSDAA
jgi:cytochrome P450